MDAKTLKALKGSIKKWELIVSGDGADDGSKNCPLCLTFKYCEYCPVNQKVNGCYDSPYDDWDDHQRYVHKSHLPTKVKCPTCRDLAQAELDFLKSLLPEGK